MASPSEEPIIWAIRFTSRASDDIQAVEDDLVETAGDELAQAWSKGLIAEVTKLAQSSTIWPIAEENRLFKQSVRRMLYRRTRRGPAYRVLFVLRQSPEDAPTVGIIHVGHSARAPMTQPMTQEEAREIEASE